MSGISSTSAQGDSDSPIRVVVTPAQSSYFAGEPFSVSITFTNTRSAESPPSRPHSHKRGAHSISSAPLARPPTSPGTPRTAVPIVPTRGQNGGVKMTRKGFIGKVPSPPNGIHECPDVLEQSRKRLFAKSRSLSVDVVHPHEVPPDSKPESAQYVRAYDDIACEFIYSSTQLTIIERVIKAPISPPVSLQTPPSFGRSQTVPRNHPHARKLSVFDGQLSLPDPQGQPQSPVTSSSSNSTFSLSLDPISERSSSPQPFQSFIPSTPSTSMHPNGYSPRHIQKGLGHGRSPQQHTHPHSAFSSTFPQSNTELILYSYAQLTGTVSLSPLPPPSPQPTLEQSRTLNAIRSSLLKRSVVGGGSMDITSSLHQRTTLPVQGVGGTRKPHKRSSSFSTGLLSFMSTPSPPPSLQNLTSTSSPSLLLPSLSWSPASQPRTSSVSIFSSISSPGLIASEVEEVDPDVPLTTFAVPKVMLAVDLSLGPGESRTCKLRRRPATITLKFIARRYVHLTVTR